MSFLLGVVVLVSLLRKALYIFAGSSFFCVSVFVFGEMCFWKYNILIYGADVPVIKKYKKNLLLPKNVSNV